ncbi:MAG: hypothetical protein RL508_54 [Actinomycetota bacterium]|jgi:CubicO group peptidase (beta-lactamase class C family)
MELVKGTFEARFEPLVTLFEAQGRETPAGGSSLAVFRNGEAVVNVWQGEANAGKPWAVDTVSTVFSCTKGIVTILATQLIEQGLLDLELPVAHYWPEFAQGGKGAIKVKTLLQHRAGLSATRRNMTRAELLDGTSVVDELAKQEPLWAPDSNFGYHALTFGHLVGKLISNVTGLSANEYLQEHVTKPLGVDMWIGMPADQYPRVAKLITNQEFVPSEAPYGSDQFWSAQAMTLGGALPTDPTAAGGFSDLETLSVELGGAGGVTNAYGLAKIYSATVTNTDGIRLVGEEALTVATRPASFGENVWHEPGPYAVWGNGFMLPSPPHFEMPGGRGFGHNGFGGQAGWASLDERIGFGYTTSFLRGGSEMQASQQALVKKLRELLA